MSDVSSKLQYPVPTQVAEDISARQYSDKDRGDDKETIAEIDYRVALHIARAEAIDLYKAEHGMYPEWYPSFQSRTEHLKDLDWLDEEFILADKTGKRAEIVSQYADQFYDLLRRRAFSPAGRILAGAGTSVAQLQNCVSGDTLVHTAKGIVPIRELEGDHVILTKGGILRKATFKSFGVQELYEVVLASGHVIRATADHEWLIYGKGKRVRTRDLRPGDLLPVVPDAKRPKRTGEHFREGARRAVVFARGITVDDGDTYEVQLLGEEQELTKLFKGWPVDIEINSAYTRVSNIPGFVESMALPEAKLNYWHGFIAGLIAITPQKKPHEIIVQHKDKAVLEAIREKAIEIGILPEALSQSVEGGKWTLSFAPSTVLQEERLNPDHVDIQFATQGIPGRDKGYVPVAEVRRPGIEEEVFCCTEMDTHTMVIAGGILTGQCFVFAPTGGYIDGAKDDKDSIAGIYELAYKLAETTKTGGGCGIGLGFLRERGSHVSGSGGTSSGPVSFLRLLYNPTLRNIKLGGCLHPDTLVHTDQGTLRLSEIVGLGQEGWHAHAYQVATDEGWKSSPEAYNHGVASTLKVNLGNGVTLQGTPNHKIKVIHADGSREWKELSALQVGVWAIQRLGEHRGATVNLQELAGEYHHNAQEIRTPSTLDTRLGYVLGYLFGNGSVSGNTISFAVPTGAPVIPVLQRYFRELFGLQLHIHAESTEQSYVQLNTGCKRLVDWLRLNGICKGHSIDAHVPEPVRRSPPEVVAAFIGGLMEADGGLCHGYPQLCTSSARLAQDVHTLLGGLGIPANIQDGSVTPSRLSQKPFWLVKPVSHVGLQRYTDQVPIIAGSRFSACLEWVPDQDKESVWPIPHAQALLGPVHEGLVAGVKGSPSEFTQARKTLSRYMRGERQLTLSGYRKLTERADVGHLLPKVDEQEFYTQVVSVEDGGEIVTLDLSVDENHTYIANGLVTHNSRRGAGMATLPLFHPDALDFLTAKDFDREALEGRIEAFNLSFLVTDKFMQLVEEDGMHQFISVATGHSTPPGSVNGKYHLPGETPTSTSLNPADPPTSKEIPLYYRDRNWEDPEDVSQWTEVTDYADIHKFYAEHPQYGEPEYAVHAKWLWDEVSAHAWATGDPGVIFIDRMNEFNPLLEHLGPFEATNPCGEQNLWDQESCDLGSAILSSYVKSPLINGVRVPYFDFEQFEADVPLMIRFLDNVLTITVHPLSETQERCDSLRRVGLGVMGDADTMIKMRLPYASKGAMELRRKIATSMRNVSRDASETLAQEKGEFPLFEKSTISRPRRNVFTLSIAPTGSIAMRADVNSGIEPIYALVMARRVGTSYIQKLHPLFEEYIREERPDLDLDDPARMVPRQFPIGMDEGNNPIFEETMIPDVLDAILDNGGSIHGLDQYFSPEEQAIWQTAHDISPEDHVRVQSVWQTSLDSEEMLMASTSKTCNLPEEATIEDVQKLYALGFQSRLKGITMYRNNSRKDQVLRTDAGKKEEKEEVSAPEVVVEFVQPGPAEAPPESVLTVSTQVIDVPAEPYRAYRGVTTDGQMYKATFADGVKSRKVYVYVGTNEDGYPVEVFVNDDRAGRDIAVYADTVGILLSLALKYEVPIEEITRKLQGQQGDSTSFSGGMFQSVPDLVAKRLLAALEAFEADAEEDEVISELAPAWEQSGTVGSIPTRTIVTGTSELVAAPVIRITTGQLGSAGADISYTEDKKFVSKPVARPGYKKCDFCDEIAVPERGKGGGTCPPCENCGASKCS